ncbi:hypothetical protein ACFL1R_09240 [Candidatus Latescibacterota bacterium]
MELLKTQKNKVLNILQEQNLPLSDFKWKHSPYSITNDNCLILNYKDGKFYFDFCIYKNKSDFCRYSPAETRYTLDIPTTSWGVMLANVTKWAYCLKREIEAPDLWEEFEKYRTSFSLVPSGEIVNENIPYHEAERIIEAIHSLESEIAKKFELDEQQIKFVNSKLEYLEGAVKRLGRLDWVSICMATFMSIASHLALNPEEAVKLGNLFKTYFEPFFQLLLQ